MTCFQGKKISPQKLPLNWALMLGLAHEEIMKIEQNKKCLKKH